MKTTKRKGIPYGMTNFEDIRTGNYYYVDKTAYIEKIEEANRFFFFIRPRRFGKTLLVSTLQHYYDRNRADKFSSLFGDLYIGKHPTPDHNTYGILSLNFSRIDGGIGSYRKSLDQHCETMFDEFCIRYADILPAGTAESLKKLDGAVAQLGQLSAVCERVGLKIYLFIDEYDHFTNDILASPEALTDYEDETHRDGYFRKFFNVIKADTTSAIKRCFITGVSPVTLDDLTSGFNIGTNYTAKATFNGMIGFSEAEVREMLNYYRTTCEFHHSTDELIERMKPWYDNYCFAVERFGHETMFNSNMVLYFVDNYIGNGGNFPSNMLESNIRTDYSKLRMLIRKDKTFANDASVIQTIVNQGYIIETVKESFPARSITAPENFISLLYYFGMLTIGGTYRGKQKLIIPNEVVREQLYTYLLNTYEEIHLSQDDHVREELAANLAYDGDWRPYFQYIADCLTKFASTRDAQKGEAFVHGFTLAMTALSNYYRPVSETDAGRGYADIFLSPQKDIYIDMKHSYLIEFKYVKRSEPQSRIAEKRQEAIEQVKRYAVNSPIQSELRGTRLHSLVIVFYGMEMAVAEEIL